MEEEFDGGTGGKEPMCVANLGRCDPATKNKIQGKEDDHAYGIVCLRSYKTVVPNFFQCPLCHNFIHYTYTEV